jgi:hypothetical protein
MYRIAITGKTKIAADQWGMKKKAITVVATTPAKMVEISS